jgi:hypothetical protein
VTVRDRGRVLLSCFVNKPVFDVFSRGQGTIMSVTVTMPTSQKVNL